MKVEIRGRERIPIVVVEDDPGSPRMRIALFCGGCHRKLDEREIEASKEPEAGNPLADCHISLWARHQCGELN